MVQIDVVYRGDLCCESVHAPSKAQLSTDAPLDNQGRGLSFSPTDLVATALGSCMLTTMGIVAKRHGWKLEGARARVIKFMVADPARRIAKLETELVIPGEFDQRARQALELAAKQCPVHKTLSASVELPLSILWTGNSAPAASLIPKPSDPQGA